MRFGKWILAASAPLLLASCGGGGDAIERINNFHRGKGFTLNPRPPPSPPIGTVLKEAENLEMTYRSFPNSYQIVNCSVTTCTSNRGHDFSISYHSQFLDDSETRGETDSENTYYDLIKESGQYSGYYTINFWEEVAPSLGRWKESFGAAFGRTERKPTVSATWKGKMAGYEIRTGMQITGRSTVTYSSLDNDVDVRIYDMICDSGCEGGTGTVYQGQRETFWRNMEVRSDGSFVFDNSNFPDDYVAGNFYGPNTEESAGIFEESVLAGAWHAKR